MDEFAVDLAGKVDESDLEVGCAESAADSLELGEESVQILDEVLKPGPIRGVCPLVDPHQLLPPREYVTHDLADEGKRSIGFDRGEDLEGHEDPSIGTQEPSLNEKRQPSEKGRLLRVDPSLSGQVAPGLAGFGSYFFFFFFFATWTLQASLPFFIAAWQCLQVVASPLTKPFLQPGHQSFLAAAFMQPLHSVVIPAA